MATKTYKWEGAGTPLPDGHRIFETYDREFDGHAHNFGVAICDDSGATPDQTDDGVLWLDETRTLCIEHDFSDPDHPREHMFIPLLDERGNKTRTPTDAATLLYLSRSMRWTIEDEHNGHFYNAR